MGLAICTKARIIGTLCHNISRFYLRVSVSLCEALSSHFLNHRTRGNDSVFGDDDDAVADGVGVAFCFADVFCV